MTAQFGLFYLFNFFNLFNSTCGNRDGIERDESIAFLVLKKWPRDQFSLQLAH